MNRYIKLIIALTTIAGYYLLLRYIAPSREPYFILGIGLVGYLAWLYGMTVGLVAALMLVPTTAHIYNQFEISTSYTTFSGSPAYLAIEILAVVSLGRLRNNTKMLSKKEAALADANEKLQSALAQVQEFGGMHCLCTDCKKIQDDDGQWKRIDTYLMEKTKVEFSHGICPGCATRYGKQLEQSTPKAL